MRWNLMSNERFTRTKCDYYSLTNINSCLQRRVTAGRFSKRIASSRRLYQRTAIFRWCIHLARGRGCDHTRVYIRKNDSRSGEGKIWIFLVIWTISPGRFHERSPGARRPRSPQFSRASEYSFTWVGSGTVGVALNRPPRDRSRPLLLQPPFLTLPLP